MAADKDKEKGRLGAEASDPGDLASHGLPKDPARELREEPGKDKAAATNEIGLKAATLPPKPPARPQEISLDEEAAFRFAFGEPRVDFNLVPRLEAALDHDSPRVLALVLTALGRALFEDATVVIGRQDRVRELGSHPDGRVAFAAGVVVLLLERHASQPESGGRVDELDVPNLSTEAVAERLGIAAVTVRQHVRSNKFGSPVVVLGGSYAFTERQARYYEQHRKPAGRPPEAKQTDATF